MTIELKYMDIMTVPQGYYLATAISSDKKFNVGLPALFEERYNLSEKLDRLEDQLGEGLQAGDACLVDNVFLLVVKDSSYDKPDPNALKAALVTMHECIQDRLVKKLAVPKICCGRNGLYWENVRSMIEEEFADEDIDILVCVW